MNTAVNSVQDTPKAANRPPIALNLLIALGSLLFALIAIEVGLRIIGFSYRLYPEKLEFGYPDFKTMESRYVEDPNLFWTPKDYGQRIQDLIAAPPEIVFMGDSCTEFGTYDRTIDRLLKQNFPDRKIPVAKIGVAGWASYQGRMQMQRDVTRIKPKIATIYYGWNDHWLGFGIEDKDVARLHSPFWSTLNRLRVVQLATKAYLSLGKKERSDVPQRVALPDFKENLKAMIDSAKSAGVTPMLVTAPTSQVAGKEPAYLKGRFLVRLEDLVPLHNSYVDAVREVAAREQVPLCDLFAKFKALPQRDVEMKYFKNSGIHLTDQGNEVLGQFMFDCLRENGLLKDL